MLLSGNLFQTPALVLHSSGMAVICSSGNVGKGQSAVFFFGPPDIPFVFKEQNRLFSAVLHHHGRACEVEPCRIVHLRSYPSCIPVGKVVDFKIDAVFMLQYVLLQLDLQDPDCSHFYRFHD